MNRKAASCGRAETPGQTEARHPDRAARGATEKAPIEELDGRSAVDRLGRLPLRTARPTVAAMDRRQARKRWIFPLALEPIALEPNEYDLREAERPPPADAGAPQPPEGVGSGTRSSTASRGKGLTPSCGEAQPSAPGNEPEHVPPRRPGGVLAAPARLVRAWRSHHRARIRRRALQVALWRFARLHPHWYDAMFDDAFLRRLPAASLSEMEASVLAREWTRQFRYHDVRRVERDARLVTPVAESFLALLQAAEREEGLGD